jgi:SAM-dependent methyltransferase
MRLCPDLSQRHRRPEIMDQPDLEARHHFQALRGLERINFWSGSARILWPGVRGLAGAARERPLRLLDVACGAGDVPIRLWRRARRAGIPLDVDGCDLSPRAVAYASARAARHQAAVRFFVWDAIHDQLPAQGPGYDVITCSLFLHHLPEEEAAQLLRRLGQLAGRVVLVNDLVRGRAGFLLAYVGTRLLSSCRVVHTDGPRSVEAAFSCPEVLELARRAGLEGARVERRWPCRFLLTWRRPGA